MHNQQDLVPRGWGDGTCHGQGPVNPWTGVSSFLYSVPTHS